MHETAAPMLQRGALNKEKDPRLWLCTPWNLFLPCCRLVGTVGKGMRAWHVDTKRMVAHMRLEPMYPDVWDVACSPAEPTIACASSASQSQSKFIT